MEIKEFFDSNFSNILRDHSCPDHETAFKDVKERAKRMKNKESNVRQIQFKEVPVDYTEPKKSAKVLHAVAGVAGAAAVLTGAVFGLKFLNDHGGLKEGGIDTGTSAGAAYHEDISEPTQSEAAVTEAVTVSKAKTEVPAVFVHKTLARTVTVKSFEFDGRTLNFNYDVDFDMELEEYYDPEDSETPLVNGMKNMDAFSFMGEPDENIKTAFISTNSVSGRTINHTMTVELERFAYSVDVIFPPTVIDEFDVPEYTFTVTVNAENVQPAVNEDTGKMIYHNGIVMLKYDDGSTVTVNSYTFDGTDLELEYSVYVPEGSAPDHDPLSFKSPVCRTAADQTIIPIKRSGEVPTYRVTLKTEEYSESVDLYFLPAYSSEEEYEKVIADQDRYKFTAVIPNGEEKPPAEETENTEQLPEFPKAISNGNGFYGEFLDTPITGDEAWELVKERGGIDFDYNLPYDKSLFVFDGCEFYINYADRDVTALVGGTVEFAGYYNDWGNSVLIRDDNGHYWLWGHLAKELNVAEDDTVVAGEKIGHTGQSGYAFCQCYAMRVG